MNNRVLDTCVGFIYIRFRHQIIVPIVTHMDAADPKSKIFVFDMNTLEKEGALGLFHELGHNRQKSTWSKYVYE
jgi:hypothetical protein